MKKFETDARYAGIFIPLFSVRTKASLGVGEFLDLKILADWAHKVGYSVIQILPINDTSATFTAKDAVPYSPISAFALHPIYINIEAIGTLPGSSLKNIERLRKELDKEKLDYERVITEKFTLLRELYEMYGEATLESEEFATYYRENEEWLLPYASYCVLRDRHGHLDFERWNKDSRAAHSVEGRFYQFLQFHLDKQLREAVAYCESLNIRLKGDLPIGVTRKSVEVWSRPDLFRMDHTIGAPADSIEFGQNWQLAAYNLDTLHKEKYHWLQLRMQKLARYFSAMRIDHALGLFRFWEIPDNQVLGVLGYYTPGKRYTKKELQARGLNNLSRLTQPFINEEVLEKICGAHATTVKNKYLDGDRLKAECDNEKKIAKLLLVDEVGVRECLWRLIQNVILVEDKTHPGTYSLRRYYRSSKPLSYKYLDEKSHKVLDVLYQESYSSEEMETIWKEEAQKKIHYLRAATQMYLCAEDIGEGPKCVDLTLKAHKINTLEIFTLPKDIPKARFLDLGKCTRTMILMSTNHDIETLRLWWLKESQATLNDLWKNQLKFKGLAPKELPAHAAEKIITLIYESQAHIVVIPIQDLFATNESMHVDNPLSERINYPGCSTHIWDYRIPMTVESLIDDEAFTRQQRSMLEKGNRL